MIIDLLVSFLAGIASVVSPCVLPLIPIIVAHSFLRRKTSQTLSFVLGFVMVFSLVILFTLIFTAAINYYLFYFRIIAALLIITIGIYFITDKNIFKFTYTPKYKNTILGSFSMGVLTCLAWSSCFGPYLIVLIAYSASTGNLIYSAVNLALFIFGFALSIFCIAFLASKVNLEKLIKASKWVRIFSGVIIIIAGFYMLYVVLG
ncbi:MAG: cytochrome c biogenesis protein CcdA [Euryarchaeota archaeon]|nr:cytochrome c biogenesis protein CcdA [Euryarchaeota archaeon]